MPTVEDIPELVDALRASSRATWHDSPREIVAGIGKDPMRQNGERVHGPYLHRNRWRIVLTGAPGVRETFSFDTEAEAQRYKRALQKEITGRTVSDAVQDHIVAMRERGLRKSSVARAETHLRRFFQLDGKEDGDTIPFFNSGGMLEDLRPQRCEQLYTKMTKDVSVDTHRNALAAAKTFGAWCVKQKWIPRNPVEDVEPIGQRNPRQEAAAHRRGAAVRRGGHQEGERRR